MYCEIQCAAILYFYAKKAFLVSGFSPSFQKINTKFYLQQIAIK